jgi:hypothetical protein
MSGQPDTISSAHPSARPKIETAPEYSLLRIKQRKRGWVPVSRALIDDSRLQFDTRGVANWLVAKPDGWQIRLGALPHLLQQRAGPGERMGRDRVRRILRELELGGYLSRTRSKTPDGRWTWRIEFSDTPVPASGGSSTIDDSAVDGSPVGGSAVDGSGVDLVNTLNNYIVDKLIPTTTSEGSAASNTEGSSSAMDIQYPLFLQAEILSSARKVIELCPPDQRQAVLDEIGAMHARGKVRSPLGLLKALVHKAATGQFVPSLSVSMQSKFATKQPRDALVACSAAGANSAPRPPAPASEIGRETLSRLRKMLHTEGN